MAGLRNEYSTFPHFGGYVKECPRVQETLAHIFRVMGHQVQQLPRLQQSLSNRTGR